MQMMSVIKWKTRIHNVKLTKQLRSANIDKNEKKYKEFLPYVNNSTNVFM